MAKSIPTTTAARGRPRAFQQDEALDRALKAFWVKGYSGTSLDDLTAATELHRPSLYAAFGNKEALYAAAVDRYVATIGAGFLEPLLRSQELSRGLQGFYEAVIDTVTGKHGPLGCIVACTLPAEAGASQAARDHLSAVLGSLDEAVQAGLTAARDRGQLAKDADLKALAQVVTGGMLSISIRARGGASRRELLRIARTVVALVTRT